MNPILLFILILIALIIGGLIAWLLANSKNRSILFSLEERNKTLSRDIENKELLIQNEQKKREALNLQLTTVRVNNEHLEKKLREQLKEIEELNTKLTSEFENIANKIIDNRTEKLNQQHSERLDQILKPFKEEIKEFKSKVERTNKDNLERDIALREQLKHLQELNVQMSSDAKNLAKALKGDSKTQGNWGELILEKILEKSGLQKGREYFIQESLKNEEGKRLQPDVVISLPENKKLIIDSKVSLVAYEKYINAEDKIEQQKHLNDHLISIKNHIKSLSEKNYQKLYETESPDFVLMFMPIEPAFNLAIKHQPELYNNALERNVVIVSTSTLYATLSTIASIWKQEYQNRNVLKIAKESGAMYDKFKNFVDDLIKMGELMNNSKKFYDAAMNKLVDGKGNLVRRAENIKALGAKATKALPEKIVERANEEEDTIDG